MTPRLSSWLFSRNPRILLIVLGALWLAQMAFWAIWEWQREPLLITNLPEASGATHAVLSVESATSNAPPLAIPESPFLSGSSEVLNRYFDYANAGLDATSTSAYSESEPPIPILESEPLPPPDLPFSVLVETNGVDFSETLRYRGFLQASQGGRIAFIEDVESASTHRLRVGDRFKDWILQSIMREEVIFASDEGVRLTVSRQKAEAEIEVEVEVKGKTKAEGKAKADAEAPTASKADDTEPALVTPPVETAPQSETNSIAIQEEPQP